MYIIYLRTICIVYDEEKFRYFIPCYESHIHGTTHLPRNMKNQQQLQQKQKKRKKKFEPHTN